MHNKITPEQDAFQKFEQAFAEERAAFFNCLTKEQQLLVFCEVVHKLVNSELIERRSYRGVLYEEFGFDTDSYAKAQISGFLELHNSIEAEPISILDLGVKVLSLYGIDASKKDLEEKIKQIKDNIPLEE